MILCGAIIYRPVAGRRHVLGNEAPDTMIAAADLAMAYVYQQKLAEAEPLAREAMQTDSRDSA